MKLIFDFDDTIFDTNRLKKERLFPCLEKYGVSQKKFEKSYLTHRKKYLKHDIDLHFEELIKEFNLQIKPKEIITDITSNMQEFILPEYKSIFETYSKENIFIITQGQETFQKLKIKNSHIEDYVSDITIVEGSKKEEISLFCKKYAEETVLFFDDKYEHVNIENPPTNLICFFMGNKEMLSTKQIKKLENLNVQFSTKTDLKTKISIFTEEN